MSFETWKKEFFINDLKKWEGLSTENLRKHLLEKIVGRGLREIGKVGINYIGGDSCSLCHRYYDDEGRECLDCPIKVKNGVDCSGYWGHWVTTGDVEPMVGSLKDIPEASVDYNDIEGFLDECRF